MDFKQNLIQKFKDKNLSDSSIKTYIRNLEMLNDDKPFKNLNFLNNKESIDKIIETKKPNTQKNYYTGIVTSLKHLDKKNKVYDYYYKKMMDLKKEIREETEKGEKTETQKNNWIDWEDLEKKLEDLKSIILTYPKNVSEKQYHNVLKFIVLSLYIKQQPRRNADYQFMNIVKSNPPDNNDLNYLVFDKQEFYFRKYKTAKAELKDGKKELIVAIDNELFENIKIYLKFHPLLKSGKIIKNTDVPFLVNHKGESLKSVNSITYILNSITGKKIGSSMMRHLFLSSKYGDKLDEMQKDAKAMSHSIDQQKDYIKK
jgi:hypothetical protein